MQGTPQDATSPPVAVTVWIHPMRRLSIARSVQLALLGLTVVLTAIAAIGVASLYSARQHYEDTLSNALTLQARAGQLIAAGVVEEATLRLTNDPRARRLAKAAYLRTLRFTQTSAREDPPSAALLRQSAAAQARTRSHPGDPRSGTLAARNPLTAISQRQTARVDDARHHARERSRRALIAIIAAGGLALLVALGLVAILVAALRRPLDELVGASAKLASGDQSARVDEDEGPDELRALARSFNRMAGDVQAATERVEAERRRLDATVRSLGDALIIVGADGVVAAANPRAAELAPELIVGTTVGGEDSVAEPAPLADALAGEVSVEQGIRTLAVTASRLEAGAGTVWTVRDVSERARLERLKSEFVATASHELRSPLTSIKGFVELLAASSGLDARQQEFLDIVLMSTNRLVDLVNDLLDVARVEAGRIEIHRRPTDLHDIVRETTTLMSPRLAEKQQTLNVEIPDDLPRALVDPSRIRQILTNLLTNAHLYTEAGGRLGVIVRASGHTVELEVSDTGRGMSDEEAEHVFDRFYRVAGGDIESGTGLGLAIVKSLVDLHGGTIDVESAPGSGTTFRIRLPRAADRSEGAEARAALGGKRVLVVDDEDKVAQLVATTLRSFGVEPTIVHDGATALQRLRSGEFDALTLDILMPGMSGFEVLRALRSETALQRVPVVVVSVFSGREALSGEWVVAKPIDAEELADALGSAVLAGRVRVLAIGRPEVRERMDTVLDDLGIEHEWAHDAESITRLSASRFFEVAAIDAGLPDADAALAALHLRGRRLRRSVVVFADDAGGGGFARLDAEPVAIEDAGALVLGLLESG
jgi:signal transduction histidine kinase/CheY-like chemotaxis protein/HAMP domain-containing protein